MNVRKLLKSSSKTKLYELVELSAPGIVACGILIVLFATLFPFNFAFKDGFSIQEIISSFQNQSNLRDWLANVLLFIPFGFGLACLLQKNKLVQEGRKQEAGGRRQEAEGSLDEMGYLGRAALGKLATIIGILLASFCLSLTVEILQVFLPGREPNPSDLLLNSLNGVLGFFCFHRWRTKVLSQSSGRIEETQKSLSLQQLIVGILGYLTLVIGISFGLQTATNLSNWDDSFSLSLGNESTGDRPWQGYISEIAIVNRAISKDEIKSLFSNKSSLAKFETNTIVSYQLIGQGNYQDQTKQLPDLTWQGKYPHVKETEGVFLSPSHWLATSEPATLLSQKLQETSQFTLSTTIATADTAQMGLARIISLSGDPYHRNFTLGQEESKLILRLRTPLTGENGTIPPMVLSDVFVDTDFHHLIITYDGSVLQFYLDQLNRLYSIDLKSGLSWFYVFKFPHWNAPLYVPKLDLYRIVYYGIIFIPLGIIIGITSRIVSKGVTTYSLLIAGGVLLPPLILEGTLAIGGSRVINQGNLLISIVITGVTMLLFKKFSRMDGMLSTR